MSIYRRASKRYAVVVAKEQGAHKRVSLGTFRTLKEAESAERKALEARETGNSIGSSKATIFDVVTAYIKTREAKCGRDTLDEYDRALRLYIDPHSIGSMVARALKPAHVVTWYATLLREGGRPYKNPERGRRSLSGKTAWNAFAILSSALEWGMRAELLTRNVCKVASQDLARPQRATARAFTDAEVIAILSTAAKGETHWAARWSSFVTLAFATGCRRGELLALDWSAIDLDAGRMLVRASYSETSRGHLLKGTKTDRERVVELSRVAVASLRAQRRQQAADRLAAVPGAYAPSEADRDAVFSDELGGRCAPKQASWAFRQIALAAGVSWTRLHGARHTLVSNMIADGTDVVTASKIAGHASPTVTLGTYAHVVQGRERAAIDGAGDRLERLMRKGGQKRAVTVAKRLQTPATIGNYRRPSQAQKPS